MKRFTSPLQSAQKMYAHRERTVAARLAAALSAIRHTSDEIDALHRARDGSYQQNDWDEFATIYWAHQYRTQLQWRVTRLQERLHSEEKQLDTQRQEYRRAYLQNRAFQILIDKQLRTYQKKQNSMVEDYADDINRHLLHRK